MPSSRTNPAANVSLNPQLVGNVGLYYCCYHLSLRGWNVMPTARNARGVDIIAYNQDATGFVGIQVKTLSKRSPVPLYENLDRVIGDYWIVVNQAVGGESPRAYVLLPKEVKERAHRGEKNGKISHWLQPKEYECDRFAEAWDRIKTRR